MSTGRGETAEGEERASAPDATDDRVGEPRPHKLVTFGTDRDPRQFSVGLVFQRAADTYRTAPWLILRLALVVFLPLSLLDAGVATLAHHLESEDVVTIGVRTSMELLDLIVDLLGFALFGGLLDHLVGAIHHGHEAHRPHEVARRISYGRLLSAAIIFNLVVVTGTIFLIVPGLIVFTLFAFVAPIINIERRSVREAFGRSYRIARRYPLGIVVTVTIPFVVEQVLDEVVEGLFHGFWGEFASGLVLSLVATATVVLLEVCTAYHLLELESERTGEPGPSHSPAH